MTYTGPKIIREIARFQSLMESKCPGVSCTMSAGVVTVKIGMFSSQFRIDESEAFRTDEEMEILLDWVAECMKVKR